MITSLSEAVVLSTDVVAEGKVKQRAFYASPQARALLVDCRSSDTLHIILLNTTHQTQL